jgi:hypothetical protein
MILSSTSLDRFIVSGVRNINLKGYISLKDLRFNEKKRSYLFSSRPCREKVCNWQDSYLVQHCDFVRSTTLLTDNSSSRIWISLQHRKKTESQRQ